MNKDEEIERVAIIRSVSFGVVPDSPFHSRVVLTLDLNLGNNGACTLFLREWSDIDQVFSANNAQNPQDLVGKPIWVIGEPWGSQRFLKAWR